MGWRKSRFRFLCEALTEELPAPFLERWSRRFIARRGSPRVLSIPPAFSRFRGRAGAGSIRWCSFASRAAAAAERISLSPLSEKFFSAEPAVVVVKAPRTRKRRVRSGGGLLHQAGVRSAAALCRPGVVPPLYHVRGCSREQEGGGGNKKGGTVVATPGGASPPAGAFIIAAVGGRAAPRGGEFASL